VVYRGGLEGLEFIKKEAKRILKDFNVEAVREFDEECIRRNLSPGGSADLLAVTAMLHMIIK
jgi:triphosphoribosyl-dephospho-CoA synthetase